MLPPYLKVCPFDTPPRAGLDDIINFNPQQKCLKRTELHAESLTRLPLSRGGCFWRCLPYVPPVRRITACDEV